MNPEISEDQAKVYLRPVGPAWSCARLEPGELWGEGKSGLGWPCTQPFTQMKKIIVLMSVAAAARSGWADAACECSRHHTYNFIFHESHTLFLIQTQGCSDGKWLSRDSTKTSELSFSPSSLFRLALQPDASTICRLALNVNIFPFIPQRRPS